MLQKTIVAKMAVCTAGIHQGLVTTIAVNMFQLLSFVCDLGKDFLPRFYLPDWPCQYFSYTASKKKLEKFSVPKPGDVRKGHKKGRSFVLAEESSAPEREDIQKRRPNASRHVSEARPRACTQDARKRPARTAVYTVILPVTFRLGRKYEFYLVGF